MALKNAERFRHAARLYTEEGLNQTQAMIRAGLTANQYNRRMFLALVDPAVLGTRTARGGGNVNHEVNQRIKTAALQYDGNYAEVLRKNNITDNQHNRSKLKAEIEELSVNKQISVNKGILKDRISIVTGGSSGVGRGIALEFAREGARVAIADKQEAPLRGKYHETDVTTPTAEEIEKLGGQAIFIQTDVSDESQVARLFERTVQHFGGLDILVNNAGIHIPGGAQDISITQWDKVVGTNLRAVFVATKLAIPHLKQSKYGRIIQIASVHAYGGGAGPAYAPAKAGVVNMVRDTAIEVGGFGMTVNAICPGYIETALQDYLTQEMIDAVAEKTALPRFGKPRDVGRAAVFLASDDAEWITGTSLLVDGGLITGT